MRIFLVTSKSHQVIELVVGLLWISISFTVVLLLQKYFKKALKIE